MKQIETEVLILGGGLSGLIAAELLSKERKKIFILEKESVSGGLATTVQFEGFKFDIGGHRVCFNKSENINYFKDILGEKKFLFLKRKSKIMFNDRYVNYPLSIGTAFNVKKMHLLKIAFDRLGVYLKRQNNLTPDNFEDWIKIHYGKTLYNMFFKEYTEKVWGRPCGELSSSLGIRRMGSKKLSKLTKCISRGDDAFRESARSFYYPQEGMEALINAFEQKLGTSCNIHKNVRIGKITRSNGGLSCLLASSKGEPYKINFKYIFSSIPLTELFKALSIDGLTLPHNLEKGIQYRSLVLVSMIVNKKNISRWHWCYFPSRKVIFSRLHEPKFWSNGMAVDENKTLICAEVFCNYNDSCWLMNDRDLAIAVKEGLKINKLIDSDQDVGNFCVKRIRYAYPLPTYEYKKYLSIAKKALSSFNNLFLIGRNGTHSYFNMEECLDDVKEKVKFLHENSSNYPRN
ncbi:MAG: NAD(P)-binding protein [Candidatus Omnitrophica bacterium]|nr:NAD(P)-binding protein [Candidatus Omnitrophota bacterium]